MPESEKSLYKIPDIKHVPNPLISIKTGKIIMPLIPNDDKLIITKKTNDDKNKLKKRFVKLEVLLNSKNELNQSLIVASNVIFIPFAAKAPNNIPIIKNNSKLKKNLYLLIFSICKPNLNVFLSAIICNAYLSLHKTI